jgi:hypothetical protein
MANASDILRRLTDGSGRLSDCLREALLLPEVRDSPEVAAWFAAELDGYDDDAEVPPYRARRLSLKANAMNGAWSYTAIDVPLEGLPEELVEWAGRPIRLIQGAAAMEALLDSGQETFIVPAARQFVARFNLLTRRGETGIERSYSLTSVWHEVPRSMLAELMGRVRTSAAQKLLEVVPAGSLAEETAEAVLGQVHVSGSQNQIIVGSPGASQQALSIQAGDWSALSGALSSMGVRTAELDALRAEIDTAEDETTKVMRLLHWSKQTALALGLNAAGSTIATLGLQYLGAI